MRLIISHLKLIHMVYFQSSFFSYLFLCLAVWRLNHIKGWQCIIYCLAFDSACLLSNVLTCLRTINDNMLCHLAAFQYCKLYDGRTLTLYPENRKKENQINQQKWLLEHKPKLPRWSLSLTQSKKEKNQPWSLLEINENYSLRSFISKR